MNNIDAKNQEDESEETKLQRFKKNVEESREYDAHNITRYHESRRFVFNTSMKDDEISINSSISKPSIEFNIQEAFVSRLRGEFSKQEPSFATSAADDTTIDMQTIKAVEGYLRHELFETNKDGCEYNTWTDTLSGGWSVWKVWTEYAHPMSFNQVIKFGRVYEPTLTGFDPLAMLPTKSDGRYCFHLYPKSKNELAAKYPDIDWDRFKEQKNIGGFSWTFKAGDKDIVLMCDYYEKVVKNEEIVLLSDGKTMIEKDYKKKIKNWSQTNPFEQPPIVVKRRKSEITNIKRTIFISTQILEEEDTDFEDLPLVFVDGNSIYLRDSSDGPVQRMTRPYCYHLQGAQKLKNFAGQCLAQELQSMVQHKFMVAKEAIPAQYVEAYKNNQVPNVLIYNAFHNNNPQYGTLPPPREIVRPPIPPEIMNTFVGMDGLSQTILGSYDASLGVNDNQLSGVAIVEGATQSNAAAMPYVVGFLQALTQVAKIYVNLMPKYYVTARTIPVLDADSKRSYIRINDKEDPNSISFDYGRNAINVKVEAGSSFAIQKSKALNQIISASNAMPAFAQFMNEKGLGVFVSNLECKDSDQLKVMADEYMNELMQQKQQAQNQPNPMQMKMQLEQQELQLRAQKMQQEASLGAAKVGVAQQDSENDRIKIIMQAHQDHQENLIEAGKQQTEKVRAAADLAIQEAQHHHNVEKDHADHHHKLLQTLFPTTYKS
jgi:hypothetical protein